MWEKNEWSWGDSCGVAAGGDGIEGVEAVKLCSSPPMVVALERQSDASNEIATRATASCREVAMGVTERNG